MSKKIVFVSSIQIFPPLSGGQLRSANLCLSLVEIGHTVEIYSFTGRKKDYLKSAKSEQVPIAPNITEYINRNPLFGFVQYISYIFNFPPIWITLLTAFYCPNFLKNYMNKNDIIIIDFPFLYPVLKNLNKPAIINTHNAEFELYTSKTLANIVRKIEVKSFHIADKILFCNEKDKLKLTKNNPEYLNKSVIIPNGVYLSQYECDIVEKCHLRNKFKIPDNKKIFLFTGSEFKPNQIAFNEIKKYVSQNIPFLIEQNILIMVVGSVSNEIIETDYFKVYGQVEEIYDFFKMADFGINNVSTGSGTNVKMFEYIASLLPIISTEFGTRGLDLVANEHFFLINNNLQDAIVNANRSTQTEREIMAKKSFKLNINKLSMKNYLKNII